MTRLMYTPFSPEPLADAEAYHRFLRHNKHILLQIKMSIIFFIGGVVIAICVVYIVLQCKTKLLKPILRQAGSRRTSSAGATDTCVSTDTLEHLLPPDKNSYPMKIRKDTEFFVWASGALDARLSLRINHLEPCVHRLQRSDTTTVLSLFSRLSSTVFV